MYLVLAMFSVNGPMRAEIAQIPAAHAGTLQRYVTSGSHVDRVQWYMLYYYYSKKKAREPVAHTHAITFDQRACATRSALGCAFFDVHVLFIVF
jgi:hypothetical protein